MQPQDKAGQKRDRQALLSVCKLYFFATASFFVGFA